LTLGSHSFCFGRGFAPSGGGYARGAGNLIVLDSPPLGRVLGTFFAFFRIFFAFWAHLKSSWHFFYDFFRFFQFSIDFGWIWGGFGEGFGRCFLMFFRFFLKTANFVKYSVLPRKNHYICYVALLKNNEKSTKIRRKSDANLG